MSFTFDPPSDPLVLFKNWMGEAEAKEPADPNAMSVASAGEDGMPSSRMVLLKSYDTDGFVFYTNFESRKGRQILAHPKAALLFHWKSLERQVRIEGTVAQVSDEEADAYFNSRPRESRIGAWASQQSRKLEGRFELEKQVAKYTAKYAVGQIPRPPYWSGFRVKPRMIEFWKAGAFRLHERLVYLREEDDDSGAWRTEHRYP